MGIHCPKVLEDIPDNEMTNEKEARMIQEDKAASMVLNCLTELQILLTRQCTTVREIFEVLDQNYAKNRKTNALTYRSQLDALTIDPKKNPEDYFAEFQILTIKLAECGVNLDNDKVCLKYIAALPNALTALQSSCRSKLNFEGVTPKMEKSLIMNEIKEYKQHRKDQPRSKLFCPKSMEKKKNNSNDGKENEKTKKKKNYKGKFDKSKVTCHRCQKKGHFANECDKRATVATSEI